MDRQAYERLAALEDRHWWFVARRQILADLLHRHVTLPVDARILEAGCGTGGTLSMLSRFGEVCGFEPDAQARAIARGKGGYDIRGGSLPADLPFASDEFDLVGIFDVLEHVDDDVGSLQALRTMVRPGGHVIITVPAMPGLWSAHDVRHHHRRRYRRRDLVAAVLAARMSIVYLSFFNTLLFPVISGVRLIKNALGRSTSDDVMPAQAVNRALTTIFGVERHLLTRLSLPIGVSLLVVARRPES